MSAEEQVALARAIGAATTIGRVAGRIAGVPLGLLCWFFSGSPIWFGIVFLVAGVLVGGWLGGAALGGLLALDVFRSRRK